jgi:prepilin-type N-terminal cleavage/methylation domain-containing protein
MTLRRKPPRSMRTTAGQTPPAQHAGERVSRGLSLPELLVVIGILGVLMAIFVPVLAKVRRSQKSVQCISTLGKIGAALNAFAMDNQGRFPDPGTADKSWEQLILKYYPGPFECPSDPELFVAIGSSYDWRDTGKEPTTLAGKHISDVNRQDAVLAFEALPGWHAKGSINVVRIDGSAQTVPEQACFSDLDTQLRAGDQPAPKQP